MAEGARLAGASAASVQASVVWRRRASCELRWAA